MLNGLQPKVDPTPPASPNFCILGVNARDDRPMPRNKQAQTPTAKGTVSTPPASPPSPSFCTLAAPLKAMEGEPTFDVAAAELPVPAELIHLVLLQGHAPLPGDCLDAEPLGAVVHAAAHGDAVLEGVGPEEVQQGLVGDLQSSQVRVFARQSRR